MFSIAYNGRPRGRWASGSERYITSDRRKWVLSVLWSPPLPAILQFQSGLEIYRPDVVFGASDS
jgi:hypothetical protein